MDLRNCFRNSNGIELKDFYFIGTFLENFH